MRLREIRDTVLKTSAIQDRALLNLEFNQLKIDSADTTALIRSSQSCCKEERYPYHNSLGLEEVTAQTLSEQMKDYLRDNSGAISPGRITNLEDEEEEEEVSEEEEV